MERHGLTAVETADKEANLLLGLGSNYSRSIVPVAFLPFGILIVEVRHEAF